MAKRVMTYSKILAEAKKCGVDQNNLFIAAAKTYDSQSSRKMELERKISEMGLTVKKTYVKGQENEMANPLLDVLQKTEDSMNRTLMAMADMIVKFGRKPEDPDDDLNSFRL